MSKSRCCPTVVMVESTDRSPSAAIKVAQLTECLWGQYKKQHTPQHCTRSTAGGSKGSFKVGQIGQCEAARGPIVPSDQFYPQKFYTNTLLYNNLNVTKYQPVRTTIPPSSSIWRSDNIELGLWTSNLQEVDQYLYLLLILNRRSESSKVVC